MRKFVISFAMLTLLGLIMPCLASAQCTSIVVGKQASDDGSVMTAHTCDSNFRTWLTMEPRKVFAPGSVDEIRWGLMHTEEPYDTRDVEVKGSIPAPEKETFRYMNVAYPCMNEKQLAIGETTTEGRQDLRRGDALFLIEELERVALQRCSTARDAIRLMGSLAEEYGFADNGECLTVIDKNEAWFFEIYGTGKSGKKPGALWVAQRIPDDHVGISANVPRIGTVNFSDPDNFMYGSDLRERCKELGLWDGKSPFKFYKMVSEDGQKGKNFSHREVFVFNTLDPGLGLTMKDEEIPFTIKPKKKVSARQMFEIYRSTYEGTEFDMLKNLNTEVKRWTRNENGELVAVSDTTCPVSPYMTNAMRSLLNNLKPGTVSWAYTISVIQCSYSEIIKLRSWLPDEVGGVAYFAFDIPALTPRVPIYAGQTKLPSGFEVCGQKRYRKDAAIWRFRETNRLAAFGWNRTASRMKKALKEYDDMIFDDAPALEKKAVQLIKEGRKEEAVEFLNSYCSRLSASQQKTWEELKEEFWGIFARSL